jgi:hypothetical protein
MMKLMSSRPVALMARAALLVVFAGSAGFARTIKVPANWRQHPEGD